ncbi:MAG TPA: histidine--tRNA ligase [Acidimicrobiia bacterium]
MSFQPPRGTNDILPDGSSVWRNVLTAWEDWSSRFGYPLVITPIFEATDLFERGVGDTTEVVTKQMYTFEDKGGRSLTLRPEGTAGVVRAFLNSGAKGAWKGAYSGPMFRYEKPQKGRTRQFYQVGVEYLDMEWPLADVEVIELGWRYLASIGVDGLELRINSLGDRVCRPAYLEELRSYLESKRDKLCEDSVGLIERNPMRVLDCKVCGPELVDAPVMSDFLCQPCREHHKAVLGGLDALRIEYISDPALVRGLDYYTRTAFEYIGTGLDAAQNAVGGGGRYDGLAEIIGGRSVPGVGFALGIDRAILSAFRQTEPALEVFVVSETGPDEVLALVSDLRQQGWSTDFDPSGRSAKSQFKTAARLGAPITLIYHNADQPVTIRRGESRQEVPVSEVVSWLADNR